jgi:hypothetical protein
VNTMDADTGLPELLDRGTCLALVRTVHLGRVAWAEADGHVEVLPVNFALDGEDVIVRTGVGVLLAAVGRDVASRCRSTAWNRRCTADGRS